MGIVVTLLCIVLLFIVIDVTIGGVNLLTCDSVILVIILSSVIGLLIIIVLLVILL